MDLFDVALLSSVLRSSAPILLAAIGGLICGRAGVFNIALEGFMLVGAFAAVAVAFFSGSPLVGVAGAVAAAVIAAGLLAYVHIGLHGDEIVLGVAVNLLAVGTTGFLLHQLLGTSGSFRHSSLRGIGTVEVPGLASVPFLGPALSGHSWLVYLSLAMVAVTALVLYRHPVGLRLRGVGEDPDAATSLGIDVARYRYAAVLLSGVLCGLAGAQLSLGSVTLFSENMTAGRGWIAVVAVMLAAGRPLGVLGASLLFGFAEAIGFRLQGEGFPQQIADAAPYVVTLAALLVQRMRSGRPRRGSGEDASSPTRVEVSSAAASGTAGPA